MEKEFLLSVDGSEPVSLDTFISLNTALDVESITVEEVEFVRNLQVGESTYCGICEVKRIQ